MRSPVSENICELGLSCTSWASRNTFCCSSEDLRDAWGAQLLLDVLHHLHVELSQLRGAGDSGWFLELREAALSSSPMRWFNRSLSPSRKLAASRASWVRFLQIFRSGTGGRELVCHFGREVRARARVGDFECDGWRSSDGRWRGSITIGADHVQADVPAHLLEEALRGCCRHAPSDKRS